MISGALAVATVAPTHEKKRMRRTGVISCSVSWKGCARFGSYRANPALQNTVRQSVRYNAPNSFETLTIRKSFTVDS